jgi:hypothetical protein
MANNTIVATLHDPAGTGARALSFNKNGHYMAVGDANGVTHIYDLSDLAA